MLAIATTGKSGYCSLPAIPQGATIIKTHGDGGWFVAQMLDTYSKESGEFRCSYSTELRWPQYIVICGPNSKGFTDGVIEARGSKNEVTLAIYYFSDAQEKAEAIEILAKTISAARSNPDVDDVGQSPW